MRELMSEELYAISGGATSVTDIISMCALVGTVAVLPTTIGIIGYELFVGAATSAALTKASVFLLGSLGAGAGFLTYTHHQFQS